MISQPTQIQGAGVYMVGTDLGSPCAIKCSCKGKQSLFFMVYITYLSANKAHGVHPHGMLQMFPTSVQENPQYFLDL